jgi:hypothetical protein
MKLVEEIHLGLKPVAKVGKGRSGPIAQHQPGEFGHRALDVQGKAVESCLELISLGDGTFDSSQE